MKIISLMLCRHKLGTAATKARIIGGEAGFGSAGRILTLPPGKAAPGYSFLNLQGYDGKPAGLPYQSGAVSGCARQRKYALMRIVIFSAIRIIAPAMELLKRQGLNLTCRHASRLNAPNVVSHPFPLRKGFAAPANNPSANE
jgi:hypothetical protein